MARQHVGPFHQFEIVTVLLSPHHEVTERLAQWDIHADWDVPWQVKVSSSFSFPVRRS